MFKTVPQFEITPPNHGSTHTRGACRFFAVEKLFRTHWFVFEYQLDPVSLNSTDLPMWRTLLLADFGAVLDVLEQNSAHLLSYRTSIALEDGSEGWGLRRLESAHIVAENGRTSISYDLQGNEQVIEPALDFRIAANGVSTQVYWPAHQEPCNHTNLEPTATSMA